MRLPFLIFVLLVFFVGPEIQAAEFVAVPAATASNDKVQQKASLDPSAVKKQVSKTALIADQKVLYEQYVFNPLINLIDAFVIAREATGHWYLQPLEIGEHSEFSEIIATSPTPKELKLTFTIRQSSMDWQLTLTDEGKKEGKAVYGLVLEMDKFAGRMKTHYKVDRKEVMRGYSQMAEEPKTRFARFLRRLDKGHEIAPKIANEFIPIVEQVTPEKSAAALCITLKVSLLHCIEK